MSHPKDRRHRFLIANCKARKRISLLGLQKDTFQIQLVRHRDTTKRCGKSCCANRRKFEGLTRQELIFLKI
jgi:hypothetical protein